MPVAYSYIRFSTPDQIKGDSLRRQLEASKRYAAENGLDLDETLNVRDLGVSAFTGTNFERGGLGQFIAAIDDGKIAQGSYLLVESFDRLSRLPVTEALAIFQNIINRGITIVTLVDSAVYSKERLKSDWLPLLTALVSMSRAHEESLVKSRRVKAAWDAKKARVKSTKEVLSGRCPWWLRPSADHSRYEVIQENADIVKLMFQLAKDGLGNSSIAKYLNARNIPTAQHAKHWQSSTVQFNLRNIAVIGILQMDQDNNGRTTTNTFVEDFYPPIIDQSLFYEVQALRNERNRNKNSTSAGRKGQCYNMFQGTAKCGYCGSAMYLRRKPGINSGFLYCGTSLKGAGCVGVSYNLRDLESEFLQFTRELDLSKILGDSAAVSAIEQKKAELASCIGQLEEEQAKANNLLTALESGSDVAILVERLRSVERRVNDLTKHRQELQIRIRLLELVGRSDHASIVNLTRLMEQLESKETSLDEKYRIRFRLMTEVQKVVSRLDLFPGGMIKTAEELKNLSEELLAMDYSEERIATYIAQCATRPDRKARFFVAHMRNGVKRSVVNGKLLEHNPKTS